MSGSEEKTEEKQQYDLSVPIAQAEGVDDSPRFGGFDPERPGFLPHPTPLPLMELLHLFNGAVAVAALVVVGIAVVWGPLVAAKILVAGIFLGLSLACVLVVVLRNWLLVNLKDVEEMAYFFDEMTKRDASEARAALQVLNDHLDSSLHPNEVAALPHLLNHIGPLFKLLMAKEKSTMSWVWFGAKVAKDAFAFFKQQKLV